MKWPAAVPVHGRPGGQVHVRIIIFGVTLSLTYRSFAMPSESAFDVRLIALIMAEKANASPMWAATRASATRPFA